MTAALIYHTNNCQHTNVEIIKEITTVIGLRLRDHGPVQETYRVEDEVVLMIECVDCGRLYKGAQKASPGRLAKIPPWVLDAAFDAGTPFTEVDE